jgi:hypothetical protein
MDYAACNVVYVDRTAQEDRLVRREDATSTAGSDADIAPSPILLEKNLQTLLGTFSEGIFNSSLFGDITDFLSSHLYFWQILYIKALRTKPILYRRINTYPRPNRYTLRRRIERATLEKSTDTFSQFEAA